MAPEAALFVRSLRITRFKRLSFFLPDGVPSWPLMACASCALVGYACISAQILEVCCFHTYAAESTSTAI